MRKDMAKVVVEKPRRNRDAEDFVKGRKLALDDLPQYEGMKAGRRRGWSRKEFSETLNPLRRYLESQIGRRWNDVYSDICANINPNNTVQQHVLTHVFDFVEVHTFRHTDGKVYANDRYFYGHHLGRELSGLYVDPDDGILRYVQPRRRSRFEPFKRSEDYVPLGYERAYQRLNGIWFEVLYTVLPDAEVMSYIDEKTGRQMYRYIEPMRGLDVIAGKWHTPEIYPKKNRFAHFKRPMTTRELKAAGLVNVPDLQLAPTRRRGEHH